jgi:D-aminopeptidase
MGFSKVTSSAQPDARGNTTIAIVATDAPLSKAQCHRMAVAAHDGIARAIVPAHSPFDGDLVFGVSTGHEKSASLDDMALFEIGQAGGAVFKPRNRTSRL